MRWATYGGRIVVRAPAKINLFLEVLGKRPDGYHEIATLMVQVRLHDRLGFREDTGLTLRCDRPDLSTGPDNLVLKAARLLQEKTGCTKGATIDLVKRIPMAAGLAGGSTDAAAALWGLNLLWHLQVPPAKLAEWSAEIGSDIPFFFYPQAGWCTGRGEKVKALTMGRPLDLVIVSPGVGLATAAVYRGVTIPDQPIDGQRLQQALARGDIETVGRCLHNRLQESAEKLSPTVAALHDRLLALNPAGALMSGSGSSLFALCRSQAEARNLADQLRPLPGEANFRVDVVRSCSEQPLPG